jgi:hypothetical protein
MQTLESPRRGSNLNVTTRRNLGGVLSLTLIRIIWHGLQGAVGEIWEVPVKNEVHSPFPDLTSGTPKSAGDQSHRIFSGGPQLQSRWQVLS